MSRDYLAPPKPVSLYAELIGKFKGKVQECHHGEVGGIPTVLKGMMNPAVLKARIKEQQL